MADNDRVHSRVNLFELENTVLVGHGRAVELDSNNRGGREHFAGLFIENSAG